MKVVSSYHANDWADYIVRGFRGLQDTDPENDANQNGKRDLHNLPTVERVVDEVGVSRVLAAAISSHHPYQKPMEPGF